jgi:uncharacterized SAM-binding protein YcdF (DUF218 family)
MPATADLHTADAIIVHGGNEARTLYGIELYRRGLAPELWHTNYARGEVSVTATVERGIPQWSFRYLLKSIVPAVPPQSFRFLATTSTWSDGTEIAAAIRAHKLHSVIIVTDWWHSRRALCATEQQLQGYHVAISFAPSPSPASPGDWWQNADMRSRVASELGKLGYYALAYGMTPWGC